MDEIMRVIQVHYHLLQPTYSLAKLPFTIYPHLSSGGGFPITPPHTHYAIGLHVLILFTGTFSSIISPFSTFQSFTHLSSTKPNSKQKQLLHPPMTVVQYFVHTSTLMLAAIHMQFTFYMLLEYNILFKSLSNHILFIFVFSALSLGKQSINVP